MNTDLLVDLNRRFGRADTVRFEAGPGGLPTVRVTNAAADAAVSLHGAHVLSFTPRDQRDLLWLSPRARYADGQPIRGGIPVCWPWFGAPPPGVEGANHGLVRLRSWTVTEVATPSPDLTRLSFSLEDGADTRARFPHAFALTLEVSVGLDLDVSLTIANPGPSAWHYTAAFHPYFAVSEIKKVEVSGLGGVAFIDTVGGARRPGVQSGPVRFTGEVDRIYEDTESPCRIHDRGWGRRITVSKRGSRGTVVWNPAAGRAAQLDDLGAEHFAGFVCVEPANWGRDARMVAPGESATLGMRVDLASADRTA